jgi:hypothetical protein
MPTALNFFIKPMTSALATRTLVAHSVRGLANYIKTPASLSVTRHPLDFAFVLGLASHVRWYSEARNNAKLTDYDNRIILGLISDHWERSLSDLDLNMIQLRFQSLPAAQLNYAVLMLASQLQDSVFAYNLETRYSLMRPSDSIPQDVMTKLEMSLASLEASLLAKDPMMPQHLRSTHSLLISYPETVHLLDDNEIARIIDAAEMHTKTEIVKAVATKSAGTKKKVTAADL